MKQILFFKRPMVPLVYLVITLELVKGSGDYGRITG